MRKKLAKDEGARKKFRAVFTRTGKKPGYKSYSEETILLTDIRDAETDERITDHSWFTYTKGFEQAKLHVGDAIEFEARVKIYSKGYVNKAAHINTKRTDYKLSHPTKITIVKP